MGFLQKELPRDKISSVQFSLQLLWARNSGQRGHGKADGRKNTRTVSRLTVSQFGSERMEDYGNGKSRSTKNPVRLFRVLVRNQKKKKKPPNRLQLGEAC